MEKLTASPMYRRFVNNRDRSLEGLLLKTRAKVADELRKFMGEIEMEVTRTYPQLNLEFLDPASQNKIKSLDAAIDRHAYTAALVMSQHWITLRYFVAAISNAGEQQALLNLMGGTPKAIPHDFLLDQAYKPTELGTITDRAFLSLSRMRRAVMDAIEMSRILGESLTDAIKRVQKAFPNAVQIRQPATLSRVKEAEKKKGLAEYLLFDFIDAKAWESIVEEYKREFIPKWRDPKTGQLEMPVSIGDKKGFVIYPWQLENEITEDFVAQVNAGQHEGAKAQGITQFVWIAVVDNKTDDCCLKRDGLTNREIKAKLDGEWKKDECRATVPPAHFNCRCRLAPATDDLPEIPKSNAADFDDWLNA